MAHAYRARGVDAVSWSTFLDASRVPHLRRVADAYVETAVSKLRAMPWAFNGKDRPQLADAVIEKVAHRAMEQLLIAEMGRGMVEAGLTGLFVHEDVTPGVRALLAATKGVPSVHVPHGVYVKERLIGADVHATLHADRVAVCGEQQAEWFRSRGVAPERIVVTGNPAWDRFHGVRREDVPPLPIEPGFIVTFASSWTTTAFEVWQHARWTSAGLAGIAAVRRPVKLILKMHPSSPPGDEERLVANALHYGLHPAMVLRGDAARVLARSDVLVTLPSTIAIEAALLGVPFVSPEFDYEGVDGLEVDPQAVAHAIETAVPAPAFCARHNGPNDGQAAKRVAGLLKGGAWAG